MLDNLISNSDKSGADKIQLDLEQKSKLLILNFSDNGNGLPQKYVKNANEIFKPGVTDTNGGSGIGMPTIKEILKDINNSTITFLGNDKFLKGATFKIQINK